MESFVSVVFLMKIFIEVMTDKLVKLLTSCVGFGVDDYYDDDEITHVHACCSNSL